MGHIFPAHIILSQGNIRTDAVSHVIKMEIKSDGIRSPADKTIVIFEFGKIEPLYQYPT
jgi:hypothetical protein